MFRQKFQGWQIRSASWRENEGFHHLWSPRCWQHADPQTTSEAAPPKFCKNTWQLNNSFLGAFFYIHVSKSRWIQTSLVILLISTPISWTPLSRRSCPFNVTAMSMTCGCCQAPAANYRQRVLYHSKRFHEKDQQDVLQRYETRRHTMSVSELQRCTFHISSFIAKLPAAKMIQRHGGLSAVILLRHYLESLSMHGEHELCPQLSKLLTRVFMQLSANLDDVQWMRHDETKVHVDAFTAQHPSLIRWAQNQQNGKVTSFIGAKGFRRWSSASCDCHPILEKSNFQWRSRNLCCRSWTITSWRCGRIEVATRFSCCRGCLVTASLATQDAWM